VTGAAGMLGRDVMRAGERAGHELVGLSRAELDISEAAAVESAFAAVEPDAAVNCAPGPTSTGPRAKRHRHAWSTPTAPGTGACCGRAGVALVHVSTDYVFTGEAPLDAGGAPRAYVESDRTGPRSVYGQSKLEGELQVLAAAHTHAVVRSSWLFGVHGTTSSPQCCASRANAMRCRWSPTRRLSHLDRPSRPALLGLIEREISASSISPAPRTSPGTASPARSSAGRARLPRGAGEHRRDVAPGARPAWSALESEREDVRRCPTGATALRDISRPGGRAPG